MNICFGTVGRCSRYWLMGLLCLAPSWANARHPHEANAGGQPGQFDYYLLTLSWSPSYCLIHPEDRSQCSGKGFGYVLHGLWPQFESGGYPENCAAQTELTAAGQTAGLTLYPSARLMQHEWQTHGTCSGVADVEYFRTADRALAVVRIPALFEAPPSALTLSGAQIAAQFLAANPTISPDGLKVACSRGELAEVRVCLTRDLTLRACGRGVSNSCPSEPIRMPSSRKMP